jgi:NAD(P)-dependent dehydrogenase (short-subunit alcohol dehydrogenase family)
MRFTKVPQHELGLKVYCLGAREDSGNIGDCVAQRFLKDGWKVVYDDGATSDGSRPPGGNLPNDEVARAHGYTVTYKGRYQNFEAPSVQTFEQLNADALVITLGRTYKDHFAEVRDYEINNVIKANLILPLEAARRYVEACEIIREEKLPDKDGRPRQIVFVGSYAHNHPFMNGTLYCAAKAGLDMAARTLAWELTDLGYRVHIVHPYHVQGTPMWEQVERDVMSSKGMTYEEADAYNRKDLKMPDLLTAPEVADVIHTLVTVPAMEWVTGPVELYGGSR